MLCKTVSDSFPNWMSKAFPSAETLQREELSSQRALLQGCTLEESVNVCATESQGLQALELLCPLRGSLTNHYCQGKPGHPPGSLQVVLGLQGIWGKYFFMELKDIPSQSCDCADR